MKVTVLQENLAHGLSVVSRAVSPRSTLPVLSNVLVATDEGRLRFSATNLELGITCWIDAKIEEEGSTTVPARTFVDLVGTLPAEQVSLSLDSQGQVLNVRAGTSTTDIKCIDAQEFPPLPVVDLNGAIPLNVADFKEMITQVAFAASVDEARPVLMGVLLNVDKEAIIMAAADGFRLSVRKGTLSQPAPQAVTAISSSWCPAVSGGWAVFFTSLPISLLGQPWSSTMPICRILPAKTSATGSPPTAGQWATSAEAYCSS